MSVFIRKIKTMSLVQMFGDLAQAPLNMIKAVGFVAASALTFAAGCVARVLTPILALTAPFVLTAIPAAGVLGLGYLLNSSSFVFVGWVGCLLGLALLIQEGVVSKAVRTFMSTQTTRLFEFSGSVLKKAGASFQAVFTSLRSAFRSFLDGCGTLSDFAEKNVSWVGILLAAVSVMLPLVGLNTLVIPVFMAMLAPIIIGAFASGDARGVNKEVVVGSQQELKDMLQDSSLSSTETIVLNQGVQLAKPLASSDFSGEEGAIVISPSCMQIVPMGDVSNSETNSLLAQRVNSVS